MKTLQKLAASHGQIKNKLMAYAAAVEEWRRHSSALLQQLMLQYEAFNLNLMQGKHKQAFVGMDSLSLFFFILPFLLHIF